MVYLTRVSNWLIRHNYSFFGKCECEVENAGFYPIGTPVEPLKIQKQPKIVETNFVLVAEKKNSLVIASHCERWQILGN